MPSKSCKYMQAGYIQKCSNLSKWVNIQYALCHLTKHITLGWSGETDGLTIRENNHKNITPKKTDSRQLVFHSRLSTSFLPLFTHFFLLFPINHICSHYQRGGWVTTLIGVLISGNHLTHTRTCVKIKQPICLVLKYPCHLA